MKDFREYNADDFICDDDFIKWCLHPNATSNVFWEKWLSQHPEKAAVIEEAKAFVLSLHSIEKENEEINFEIEIWNKIEKGIEKPTFQIKSTKLWWSTAAAILLVAFSYFLFTDHYTSAEQEHLANVEWLRFENNTATAKSIQLTDGSQVLLEPFSEIKYPSSFIYNERKVFLKGEAFFDVARDTAKPFLIYANETITKVLGTSFTIKAFEGQKTVEVDVKTGKVAVYARVAAKEITSQQPEKLKVEADKEIFVPLPNKKLEVTPNQKVIFDLQQAELVKTLTEAPKVIKNIEELPQFKFEDASIVEVFEVLEIAYGIDLEYNAEALKKCTITTRLGKETLFEKLKIICIALDLEYKESDAVIFIEGGNC